MDYQQHDIMDAVNAIVAFVKTSLAKFDSAPSSFHTSDHKHEPGCPCRHAILMVDGPENETLDMVAAAAARLAQTKLGCDAVWTVSPSSSLHATGPNAVAFDTLLVQLDRASQRKLPKSRKPEVLVRACGPVAGVSMFVLPRFTTVDGKLIADLDRGLRKLHGRQEPFAGLAVIMLGDVRQQYRLLATTMPDPTAVISAQYWPPPMIQLATGDRARSGQTDGFLPRQPLLSSRVQQESFSIS